MGKKNKNKYSLTAKQRKDARKPLIETETHDEQKTVDEVAVKPNNTKSIIFVLTASILAAVMILLAILLPLMINPYRRLSTPVAVITLSNNMQLEFEIYEEECPFAATNFIYLAKKGYFDGAIIYDMQNYFVRFGGYRDINYFHRAMDTEFTDKIKDIVPPETGGKFTYRLKKDSSSESNNGQMQGYLSFIYKESATEFQFCVEDGASLDVSNGDGSSRTMSASSFARYLNDETKDLMIQLYNTVYPEGGTPNVTPGVGSYFLRPTSQIKIEKVKIYNLDNAKWKHFNYGEYMKANSLSSWSNS